MNEPWEIAEPETLLDSMRSYGSCDLEVRRLEGSIAEGKRYLKTGRNVSDVKLTPGQRSAIEQAIEFSRDRLRETLVKLAGKEASHD